MDLQLRGKCVLVTGASKGIGLATAEAFAAEGCDLHLTARSAEALETTKADLEKRHGIKVTVHPMDIGVSANVIELGRLCRDVDVLVNNAGEIPSGPIESISEADWRRGYDVKLSVIST